MKRFLWFTTSMALSMIAASTIALACGDKCEHCHKKKAAAAAAKKVTQKPRDLRVPTSILPFRGRNLKPNTAALSR